MDANYYKNIEYLWALLERLNKEDKLELAARLMGSLRPNHPPKEDKEAWRKLSGAWANDEDSADDLIKFLKDSRNTKSLN